MSHLLCKIPMVLVAVALAGSLGKASAGDAESPFLPKGVRNGLLVHLGSGESRLPLDIAKGSNWLMHRLIADEKSLAKARQAIDAAGLSGRASVERGSPARLPYADNMVNVLMVDNVEEMLKQGLTSEEILRVLTPRGTAFLGYSAKQSSLTSKQLLGKLSVRGIKTSEVVVANGVWAKITKPPLTGADEWTHHQYDPSGNPVSRDRLAGPPTGLRWLAGPFWPTERNGPTSAVTAHGRLFYAVDLAPANQKEKLIPTLFARDAHNGLLLWKKPTPGLVRLAFIATEKRLYCVVSPKGPLVALDSTTGAVVKTYPEAANPTWALLVDGKLLVSSTGGQLKYLDAQTGMPLWRNANHKIVPAMLRYPNVAVDQNQLFFVEGQKGILGSLDLRTGKDLWQTNVGKLVSGPQLTLGLSAYKDGVAILGEWTKLLDGKGIHAFSTKDGKHLWSHAYPLHHSGRSARRKASSCLEGFFIDGLYWIHVGNPELGKGDSWQGLDPATGVVKKRFAYPPALSVAESCQPAQATVNFLIGGHREFVDTQTGQYKERAEGVHGGCGFGMLTANGLTYSWSRYSSTYLRGEMGLESPGKTASSAAHAGERLEQGSAPVPLTFAKATADDWPSYRHDPALRGASPTILPDNPRFSWQVKVGRRLSAPVMAADSVFVAAVDEHRVVALDATNGKTRWTFTAGGRIPLPPTIDQGLCLFGSADGWVYCLDAKSGAMIWRFRAAPLERRIVVHGQLESPWPVASGVLLIDGRAYFCAGRHGSLDGGVHLFSLEARTGKVVWSKVLHDAPVLNLLASDGVALTLGGKSRFSLKTGERAGTLAVPEPALSPHFLAPAYVFQSDVVHGRLEYSGDALALAKAGNLGLLATGPPAVTPIRKTKFAADGIAYFPERQGGKPGGELILFSMPDGKKVTTLKLEATPVFDGLIVAGSRAFLSTHDGKVSCFGGK